MSSMKKADEITAIVLAVLGVAMLAGGYSMDRLVIRQIHPASIPGLVPMGLGVLLIVFAVLLFRGARAASSDDTISFGDPKKLFLTGGLCIIFAAGLVGRMPFFAATFLFVASFVFLFNRKKDAERGQTVRTVALAVVAGAIASAVISNLFQYGFLVRLP